MNATILQDIYASQVGALPWNIEDYVIVPQGTVVTIEALDGRGIHISLSLGGSNVGLTLLPNQLEEIER